jgi:hypothetical protein
MKKSLFIKAFKLTIFTIIFIYGSEKEDNIKALQKFMEENNITADELNNSNGNSEDAQLKAEIKNLKKKYSPSAIQSVIKSSTKIATPTLKPEETSKVQSSPPANSQKKGLGRLLGKTANFVTKLPDNINKGTSKIQEGTVNIQKATNNALEATTNITKQVNETQKSLKNSANTINKSFNDSANQLNASFIDSANKLNASANELKVNMEKSINDTNKAGQDLYKTSQESITNIQSNAQLLKNPEHENMPTHHEQHNEPKISSSDHHK